MKKIKVLTIFFSAGFVGFVFYLVVNAWDKIAERPESVGLVQGILFSFAGVAVIVAAAAIAWFVSSRVLKFLSEKEIKKTTNRIYQLS